MASLPRISFTIRASVPLLRQVRPMSITGGDPGSGAGAGGGTGGSIRDAGGSFGKMEHAHEEQYFRKQQEAALKKLKSHLDEEVSHHETEIKRHQDAINRHKERISNLEKDKH